MGIPFTQKMLMDWAGPSVFRDAQTLFERGAVQEVSFEAPIISGVLSFGNRSINSRARVLSDGTCENKCPCRDSVERGIICAHVIALGLSLVRRHTDPDADRKRLEEARKAARLARVDESSFIKRVTTPQAGSQPARLVLQLADGWMAALQAAMGGTSGVRIPIEGGFEFRGQRVRLDDVPRDPLYFLAKKDESILFVLEDICEGPARSRSDVQPADFINLLNLHTGKPLLALGREEPITVNGAPMSSQLKLELDAHSGELILQLHTELPFQDGQAPLYVVAGKAGWVYAAGHFWPLAQLLPPPLRMVYQGPVRVPRAAVPRFLQSELPLLAQHMAVATDVSIDLFSIEPGTPRFRLAVKGSPASLVAVLYAEYGDVILVAGKQDAAGHFSHPDPDDLLRFHVRHPAAEAQALARLSEIGLKGAVGDQLSSLVGCREVLNFLGRDLPALRRAGWKVELEGKLGALMETTDFVTPVVHVQDNAGSNWFDVSFDYDDGQGGSLSPAEVQRALLKGESYLERNGRTILLDSGAIRSMNDVFSDCSAGEGGQAGSFRLNGIYSSYVKSSLDALDGVDVEATPNWLTAARQQNRELTYAPVVMPDLPGTILRAYQRDGVQWLRFLEQNGFAGILADEMGLGKTLQTLIWLGMARVREEAKGKPALIVCPTSLVDNWGEEVAKFTPHLKVLPIAGSTRHEKWAEVEAADLVVTSYALLRRDIELYVAREFSCVVLDEAQHIKNRSTQNAIAAKRLRAQHRLVLTGTPMENSVSDLWSIMDFLMPGYMGSHETFKANYEMPIAHGEQVGEQAQARLRRKLHPFLLRRLKREVATDLPPKIEKLAHCTLSPDQQTVYKELLEASRRKVFDMVMKQGF